MLTIFKFTNVRFNFDTQRAVSHRVHRLVNILTRVILGFLAGGALVLFSLTMLTIFSLNLSEQPGISILIVAALALTIFWNIIALAFLTFDHLALTTHFIGDMASLLILSIMGGLGFAHDNKHYYYWGTYDYFGANFVHWAMTGAVLALVVVILQSFLFIWSFFTPYTAQQNLHSRRQQQSIYNPASSSSCASRHLCTRAHVDNDDDSGKDVESLWEDSRNPTFEVINER